MARIPRGIRWTRTMVELAHACADLGDESRAESILESRLPRLSDAWRRIHAVTLARAVADLNANGGAP